MAAPGAGRGRVADGAAGARAVAARRPSAPGVYRFRDAGARVLYVGRTVDLRRRAGSYWGTLGDRGHLRRMVPRIARVEAVACDSEHEAAWLERNLLERALPSWNRSIGGQEVPLYLRLDGGGGTPPLRAVRDVEPSARARHFGPYLGGGRVRLALSALHRVMPLGSACPGRRACPRDS